MHTPSYTPNWVARCRPFAFIQAKRVSEICTAVYFVVRGLRKGDRLQLTELDLNVIHDRLTRRGRRTAIPPEVQDTLVELRLHGYTYQEMADYLNKRGTPTAQGGKEWRSSSLQKMFTRLRRIYPNLK